MANFAHFPAYPLRDPSVRSGIIGTRQGSAACYNPGIARIAKPDLHAVRLVHRNQIKPFTMSSFTGPRIEADAQNEHGIEEFSYEPLPAEPAVISVLSHRPIDQPLPVIELE